MSDIKLDYTGQTGDLDTTGHRLNLATGEEAIDQQLRIRLRTFLGEWFLNEEVGFPYYREVLIKSPNLDLIRSLFVQAITSTPGILTVDEISATINTSTRTLSVDFVATMDTGEELVYSPFILEL